MQILKAAIEAAGAADPTAVRDQVFGGTFKGTVMGDITYDEGVSPTSSHWAWQWIGGKRVLIYPESGSKMEWFKPWAER